MCFDWREYFNLARCLQCKGWFTYSDEAAYRCAVSRAYYAAFCHPRNYARDNHQFTPMRTGKDHKKVRDHFQDRNPPIATKLSRLQLLRGQCDYDDMVCNISIILREALAKADEVITELS